jgi:polyphosphate kinase 2 (PPK2 family)
MDLKSYSRWFDYSRARDEMFAATDTGSAPWYVVRSDDKLPTRQRPHGYVDPHNPCKYVPAKF